MDRQGIVRRTLERILGGAAVIAGTALKWTFVFAKFFGFFISAAAYSFWFHSWTFGVGLAVLILVHELGHVLEARRQGLHVSWPMFIPFLGAYVTISRAGLTPLRSGLISLAGPFVGSLGAAAVWVASGIQGSNKLEVLANIGFLLNAFNLLPIGFLDGGHVTASIREAWRMPVIRFEGGVPMQAFAPDRARAVQLFGLYAALSAAVVLCLLATRPHGAL
jgi:membrane-associated protease RseP (regulator of RpoE activity)